MTNENITAPIREHSKESQWIKIKCRECDKGTIYILSIWDNPPRFCNFCRARRVNNKERALRVYFKNLRNKKRLTDEDKKTLILIESIEKKLNHLKKIHGDNELAVFEELIQIKKVRDILFKWSKDISKSKAYKQHKINFGTNKFTGFVQGGLPSLGKNT